jgi:hypothetical protein
MNKALLLVVAVLMLAAAEAADAQNAVVEKPLVAQTLDSFLQESATIHEQMKPGGIYASMRSADKARVETRLGNMQRLLQEHASGGDLPQADKIALINAQEEVNSILRHNDNNRVVCERRAPSGSHVPVTTCRTYREMEDERRASLNQLNEMNNLSRTNITH